MRVGGSNVNEYKAIMGLFFQHYFSIVKGVVDKEKEKYPHKKESELIIRPTLCYMDEFGNFKINNFHTEITTIRKYKIGCMVALQTQKQLKHQYGHEPGSIIEESFGTNVYLKFKLTDNTPEVLYQNQQRVSKLKPLNGSYIQVEEPRLSIHDIRNLDWDHAILKYGEGDPIKYKTMPPLELEPRPESNPTSAPSKVLQPESKKS